MVICTSSIALLSRCKGASLLKKDDLKHSDLSFLCYKELVHTEHSPEHGVDDRSTLKRTEPCEPNTKLSIFRQKLWFLMGACLISLLLVQFFLVLFLLHYIVQFSQLLYTDLKTIWSWHTPLQGSRPPPLPFNGTMIFHFPGRSIKEKLPMFPRKNYCWGRIAIKSFDKLMKDIAIDSGIEKFHQGTYCAVVVCEISDINEYSYN